MVHMSGHFLVSVTAVGSGAGASSRRASAAKGAAETDTLERRTATRARVTVDLTNMVEKELVEGFWVGVFEDLYVVDGLDEEKKLVDHPMLFIHSKDHRC